MEYVTDVINDICMGKNLRRCHPIYVHVVTQNHLYLSPRMALTEARFCLNSNLLFLADIEKSNPSRVDVTAPGIVNV